MKHLMSLIALLLFPLLAVSAQSVLAQTSAVDEVIQELVQMERQKDQAYEQGNKALLDQIYADVKSTRRETTHFMWVEPSISS